MFETAGYLAHTRGEVIHVFKCTMVSVELRTRSHCHQELPVSYNNKTVFVTPRNNIITEVGHEVECSIIFPVMYNLGHQKMWFSINNGATPALPPEVLKLYNKKDLNFKSFKEYAQDGIYNHETLEYAQKQILSSYTMEAKQVSFIHAISGLNSELNDFTVTNAFGKKDIYEVTQGFLEKAYGWLALVGSFFSTVPGVYIIFILFL